MANSKLIVVEGPQGAGKTTITDYLRYAMSYTNLYRLCGTADSSKEGKKKAEEMYEGLIRYLKDLENQSINYLIEHFLQRKIIVDLVIKNILLQMYMKSY